jgi:hypothetical protein
MSSRIAEIGVQNLKFDVKEIYCKVKYDTFDINLYIKWR